MATRFPCGLMCRYFDRPPERLVVEGFRRWMNGCERASSACFELASGLYVEELGPRGGHQALPELARWVDALRRHFDRAVSLSPFECPRLCRDECFAVSMIAACQNGDEAGLRAAADNLIRPEGRAEVIRAARAFADALSENGHILMPVPAAVLRDIAERPNRAEFH